MNLCNFFLYTFMNVHYNFQYSDSLNFSIFKIPYLGEKLNENLNYEFGACRIDCTADAFSDICC